MNDTDQPPGERKHETTVYIFNMSEDVWPFIQAITDKRARSYEIEENVNLGDRDLFSLASEDRALFIAPRAVSGEFLSYYTEVTGHKYVEVVKPDRHTGVICEDILEDPKAMGAIIRTANTSRKLTLLPYTTSPQFFKLVKVLKSMGIAIYTPESPETQDGWTVNFYGSKSGIRQLAQKSTAVEPDFKMAEGLICMNLSDAAKIAANMYTKGDGVVIKTNKGHSGAGVLIFRPGDLPDEYDPCEQAIYATLKKDSYWDLFPIIIESYISAALTVGGGNPNVEFKILKSGKVEFLYYCGMRVSSLGVFAGVEIHNDVISDKIAAQIVDTGFYIGEQYAAAGYRGYYDVDFVAGKNGTMYVTESNVRRTGGTYVYHTAVKLFGRDFMYETYTLSHNNYPLTKTTLRTFHEIKERLAPILFDRKIREGLILASENILRQNQITYIIFGKTKKRALEIEEAMEKLLQGGSMV